MKERSIESVGDSRDVRIELLIGIYKTISLIKDIYKSKNITCRR